MSADHPTLTLFSAVPAVVAQGGLLLDDKFVSGMSLHAALWPGRVRAVMREMAKGELPFASVRDPAALDFEIVLLPPEVPLAQALPDGPGIILISADMTEQLALVDPAHQRGLGVVCGIEYTLGTRLRILRGETGRGPARKLWSALWNIRQEFRRRSALRAADGIQLNGFPAFEDYAALNPLALRYLDNRMTRDMMATPDDMEARAMRHAEGRPLRLIHSGRLEPMKGAHLLVPLARQLHDARVAFTLDIYGAGSLSGQIEAAIQTAGLQDQVHLHAPLPFETGLVPVSRGKADLFISCHTQSDPSCTYLEAMGCGLPVVGFDNRMLAALIRDSNAGWCVPLGDVSKMAALISGLDRDRLRVTERAKRAVAYAESHDFAAEFDARMRHLGQAFSRSCGSGVAAMPQRHGLAG